MSRLLASVVFALSVVLAGCATPIPLNNIPYAGTVSVSTTKTAAVNIVSGAVRGSSASTLIPIGNIFVPMSTGPVPHLQFNPDDQRAFGESLRAEVVRLGLFKSASIAASADQAADISINVLFAQTFHNIKWQEYTLDVAVELQGGKTAFLKQYRVVSSEKDSAWDKWNTNAYEGKAKAVKLLLEKLIPDIEGYLAANREGPQSPPAKTAQALSQETPDN